MSVNYEHKVQEYKDSLKVKAEDLILVEFTKKIVELNDLLETMQLKERELKDIHQELNVPVPEPIALNTHYDGPITRKRKSEIVLHKASKVIALTSGPIQCNKSLCDLIHLIKPYIRQLVEHSNLLKMWISLMIPKIEDGDNFGVAIQEKVLTEIQLVESDATSNFNQISDYFILRGKLISKVTKYPHIADYRITVKEFDETMFLIFSFILSNVRNHYCSLHDIVIKNLEKIKKPRSFNAESLY